MAPQAVLSGAHQDGTTDGSRLDLGQAHPFTCAEVEEALSDKHVDRGAVRRPLQEERKWTRDVSHFERSLKAVPFGQSATGNRDSLRRQ